MLAVYLHDGQVELRDVPRPERSPGYALIRLLCGGICNTDLELQRGYYGFSGIPGHEFVGEVVQSDSRQWIGKRVVGEINLPCTDCAWCRQGMGRHCPHRSVLGIVRHPGAFAEYLTLPEANLHLVPDSLPTETAVFTEPLAAACEILDQAQLPCAARIAVLGDGKLGLLVAQVLAAHGYRVHHFGRHPAKMRISHDAGAMTYLAGHDLPAAEFQWVVEATGSAEGLRQAVQMVRPRGTVILKSTVHGLASLDTAPVVVNEITLLGSRCGRFEPALELLQSHVIQTDPLISSRVPLSNAPIGFERAAARGCLKVLLT